MKFFLIQKGDNSNYKLGEYMPVQLVDSEGNKFEVKRT